MKIEVSNIKKINNKKKLKNKCSIKNLNLKVNLLIENIIECIRMITINFYKTTK